MEFIENLFPDGYIDSEKNLKKALEAGGVRFWHEASARGLCRSEVRSLDLSGRVFPVAFFTGIVCSEIHCHSGVRTITSERSNIDTLKVCGLGETFLRLSKSRLCDVDLDGGDSTGYFHLYMSTICRLRIKNYRISLMGISSCEIESLEIYKSIVRDFSSRGHVGKIRVLESVVYEDCIPSLLEIGAELLGYGNRVMTDSGIEISMETYLEEKKES